MYSFISIAQNNLIVTLMAFVLGVFFSVGSSVYMFFNGIMVGAFQWFFKVRGLLLTSFLTIWVHGAFEISGIVIAGAAGITLGNGFMFPGTLTRMQSLSIAAKRGVKVIIGLFPIITFTPLFAAIDKDCKKRGEGDYWVIPNYSFCCFY